MAFDQRKSIQTVWAALLIGMGVLLCVKTPYAIQNASGASFLNFWRYFIAIFLIVAGVRKLYGLYLYTPGDAPPEE